ncbi:MAG: methyl-accepting chemotaxis protein [candidate division Zixibacteria bacterium]
MTRFNDFSIRVKLTLVIVLTSIITLILASIAFIITDRENYQKELVQNTRLLAQIMADNCASAVTFEDNDSAEEILQSAKRDPQIAWSVIQTTDAAEFAKYARDDSPPPATLPNMPDDGVLFEDNYFIIKRDISSGNEVIGTLWIRSDLDKLQARMFWFINISLYVLLGSAVVGIFIAFNLQRVLSRPIQELENCAGLLAVGNVDFEVNYRSKDELGRLADTFRNLQDYLQYLSEQAQRIASGDLTCKVEAKSAEDTLGNSFRSMVENLTDMVRQLETSAGNLVVAATDISDASNKMNDGARSQTEHIHQVASSIDEMAATIMESSRNAGQASEASREQSDTATSGGEIVSRTIQGMNSVADVVAESAGSIGKLAEAADKIGQIISVIEDIASQTNLLALNAAIEAARAGEQGRGFAVVADEVRNLAERTAKATGKIAEVIKEVQTRTNEAVSSMESGIKEVEKGRQLADEAGNSLSEIEQMSHNVMSMIEQIATAAEQQSQVAAEVTKRIEVISNVSKDTSEQADESSNIAQNMNRQAEELREIVDAFTIQKV